LLCLRGIIWRETLHFIHQRGCFVSAIVRPLVWLFMFAAGSCQILGISIIPPYDIYVLCDVLSHPN
jgi:ABC-2 type transport system permease protein